MNTILKVWMGLTHLVSRRDDSPTRKLKKAVTLLELVVVVAIVGILAGMGVAAYRNYSRNAEAQQAKANASLLYNAVAQAVSLAEASGKTITWGTTAAVMTSTRANQIITAINTTMATCTTASMTDAPVIFETGYTMPAGAKFPATWGEVSAGVLMPVP